MSKYVFFIKLFHFTFYKQTDSSDETSMQPPSKKPRNQKPHMKDNLLKIACEKLTNSNEASSGVLAKACATQYEELSKTQKFLQEQYLQMFFFSGI